MRGKPLVALKDTFAAGITPAHAGKTIPCHRFRLLSRDHPRACGENTSEMAYFRG